MSCIYYDNSIFLLFLWHHYLPSLFDRALSLLHRGDWTIFVAMEVTAVVARVSPPLFILLAFLPPSYVFPFPRSSQPRRCRRPRSSSSSSSSSSSLLSPLALCSLCLQCTDRPARCPPASCRTPEIIGGRGGRGRPGFFIRKHWPDDSPFTDGCPFLCPRRRN